MRPGLVLLLLGLLGAGCTDDGPERAAGAEQATKTTATEVQR